MFPGNGRLARFSNTALAGRPHLYPAASQPWELRPSRLPFGESRQKIALQIKKGKAVPSVFET
jgi:hypothetical protein